MPQRSSALIQKGVMPQPTDHVAARHIYLKVSLGGGGRFSVNVCRVDKLDNSGWAQQLRLDYIAVLPNRIARGNRARYRHGDALVGRSNEHHSVQLTISIDPPFPATVTPIVICSPRSEAGHDYMDVHSIVVHARWSSGFNITVSRVDKLGEGWGSELHMSWIAFMTRM